MDNSNGLVEPGVLPVGERGDLVEPGVLPGTDSPCLPAEALAKEGKGVPGGRGKTTHSTIHDLPPHERPREKMIERGATGLKDKELLAILLRTGYRACPTKPGRSRGKNVIEVAEEILRKHPMKKLLALSYKELVQLRGLDAGKACALLAAFELTKRALEVEDNNLPTINSARDAVAQLQELRTINLLR